jgi:hypothetical protein
MRKKDTYHVALGGALHRNLGVGVNLDAGVKDTVGNLIAKLVGVAFSYRFRSKVDRVAVVIHQRFKDFNVKSN